MKTSISDLERWMKAPREDEHLEFKEANNQYDLTKLFKYCVALANEGSGKLILGVSDKPPRRVVDSKAFRNIPDIASKILNKLHFRVDVEEIAHPDGRVVVFHIPSRPTGTAYDFEGQYLMRSGEETVPMSEDRLRQIFDEGKPDWLSQSALQDCTAAEVIRALDTQRYFDLMELPYPARRESVLEKMQSERILYKRDGAWTITNLGAVLLAKNLDEFEDVRRKAARVIVYEGRNKLNTRLDRFFPGGYAVEYENLVEFIASQTQINEIIEQALRHEMKMFPRIAIRELVANALIHQDFNETGTSVAIEIYSDRMEISNPGLPIIATDRFIDEYQSRNERLADMMRRMHICEEKGSGVDKTVSAVELFQLPAPDFRVGARRTTAVLFAHKDIEAMERSDRIRACYQHCALRYVMNEQMTNQSLRERFKLPEKKAETVSRIIRDTLDARKIRIADPTATSTRYRSYLPYWA